MATTYSKIGNNIYFANVTNTGTRADFYAEIKDLYVNVFGLTANTETTTEYHLEFDLDSMTLFGTTYKTAFYIEDEKDSETASYRLQYGFIIRNGDNVVKYTTSSFNYSSSTIPSATATTRIFRPSYAKATKSKMFGSTQSRDYATPYYFPCIAFNIKDNEGNEHIYTYRSASIIDTFYNDVSIRRPDGSFMTANMCNKYGANTTTFYNSMTLCPMYYIDGFGNSVGKTTDIKSSLVYNIRDSFMLNGKEYYNIGYRITIEIKRGE